MTFFKAGGYMINLDHVIYTLYTADKPTVGVAADGVTPSANHSPSMVLTFVGGAKLELKGQEADKVKSILSEHS